MIKLLQIGDKMSKFTSFLLFLMLFCPQNSFAGNKLLNNYQNMNILAETLLNNPQPDKSLQFIQFYEAEDLDGKLYVYSPSKTYENNTVKLMGSGADGVIYVYSKLKNKKLDLRQIVFVFLINSQQKADVINNIAARIFDQIPEEPQCDVIGCIWESQGFKVSIMKDQNSGSATVMIAEKSLYK